MKVELLLIFFYRVITNQCHWIIHSRRILIIVSVARFFLRFHIFLCIRKKRFYQLFDSPHLNFQLTADPSFMWQKRWKWENEVLRRESITLVNETSTQFYFSNEWSKKMCGLNSFPCKLRYILMYSFLNLLTHFKQKRQFFVHQHKKHSLNSFYFRS